ncbi:MAG: hypothetical protein ACRD1R_05920, partial [Acidobacteriota bacterium]
SWMGVEGSCAREALEAPSQMESCRQMCELGQDGVPLVLHEKTALPADQATPQFASHRHQDQNLAFFESHVKSSTADLYLLNSTFLI